MLHAQAVEPEIHRAKQLSVFRMDLKTPSMDTLPEEVLQCVLQHVPFKDRCG